MSVPVEYVDPPGDIAASPLERRRCEVARSVLTQQREARMDLVRPRQRRLDVRQDVVCADMVDEFGLMKELRRLRAPRC